MLYTITTIGKQNAVWTMKDIGDVIISRINELIVDGYEYNPFCRPDHANGVDCKYVLRKKTSKRFISISETSEWCFFDYIPVIKVIESEQETVNGKKMPETSVCAYKFYEISRKKAYTQDVFLAKDSFLKRKTRREQKCTEFHDEFAFSPEMKRKVACFVRRAFNIRKRLTEDEIICVAKHNASIDGCAYYTICTKYKKNGETNEFFISPHAKWSN